MRSLRTLGALFVGILLVLSLSVGVAAAQESTPEAPDPNTLTLDILTDGQPLEGVFDDVLDARLYAFNASEGDVVTITMSPTEDSAIDPYLMLMGARGQVYTVHDDIDFRNGNITAQILNFAIPETASYFVLATTFTGIGSGTVGTLDVTPAPEALTYTIEITGNTVPEELEGQQAQYFAGDITIGSEVALETTIEEPVFYMKFIGEEGQVVNIAAASPDVDTLLYLFDNAGNRLAVDDDGGDQPLASRIADFELPQAGLYLVFVTAFNFNEAFSEDWDQAGQIQFSVE